MEGRGLELVHAREIVDEGMERARRARDTLRENIEEPIRLCPRETVDQLTPELPDPWRVNPHIIKGYRFTTSKMECVSSVFAYSNEMFNIWSHVIGLVVVLAIAFYFYPLHTNFHLSTKSDIALLLSSSLLHASVWSAVPFGTP